METVISIVNFAFVIIGIIATVRFIIRKLVKNNVEYHYIVPLTSSDAELVLRETLELDKFDLNNRNRIIYAVNMGLDNETARACEMLSFDYPQIVYCLPCELEEVLS